MRSWQASNKKPATISASPKNTALLSAKTADRQGYKQCTTCMKKQAPAPTFLYGPRIGLELLEKMHWGRPGKDLHRLPGWEAFASLFAYHLGKKIWYKDGGSSRDSKKTMAPYALQWAAMQWAKNNGYETYDMVAVPPLKKRNEKSPWWGLYRFKSDSIRILPNSSASSIFRSKNAHILSGKRSNLGIFDLTRSPKTLFIRTNLKPLNRKFGGY